MPKQKPPQGGFCFLELLYNKFMEKVEIIKKDEIDNKASSTKKIESQIVKPSPKIANTQTNTITDTAIPCSQDFLLLLRSWANTQTESTISASKSVPKCENAITTKAMASAIKENLLGLISQLNKIQAIKKTAGIVASFLMKSPVKK